MQRNRISAKNDATAATWLLTDGLAGNQRQASALALALGRTATNWTLRPQAPWRWAAPRLLPGAQRAFGPEFERALQAPPHLAIGCGRQAALATRLMREAGSLAVQILDPRIATDPWDLVIAPEHDGLRGDNVITLLGSLNPVDDLWLAGARKTFAAFGQLPGPRTALLLGGSSAHARFDRAAFDALASRLQAQLEREGGSLLATTSRRTPAEIRARLRERLASLPQVSWYEPGEGANPYPGLLGWADRIVCTADSVNMLSEAAATRAPLFVFGIDRVEGRPRRFVDSLLGLRRAHAFDPHLRPYPVEPLRETARVADEVRRRLNLRA
ncbi:mitochondrial fission ELM1 family protein [Lysobacter sp. K5869]|uniref:mitochondrial fission ELM1 family protein n=1 Tax=Lysobacter sp. K5869 TaxID=2820808 RepID=UPI002100F02D|nr:mitochondrial fission ELM1 family protein [Lysobacter sp. K5869]